MVDIKATEVDEALHPKFDDEQRQRVLERRKAMDDLLEKECIGKYKIELLFSYSRSLRNPTAGALSVWESGAKLHGGGDAKVYFCPGRVRGVNDCEHVIPADNANFGHCLCPGCGTVWEAQYVLGEVMGRYTMQTWAEILLKYYQILDHNADIYIKQPKSDIRAAARAEQEKQLKGDKLNVVRAGMRKVIYPLKRIIADTSAGADLYTQFHTLLKS